MTRRAALLGLLSTLSRASWTLAFPSVAFAKPLVSPFSHEVRALLELPEDKIDLGRAALTFGKEIYPAIDIEAYSRKIDAMATDAGRFVQRYAPQSEPESIIRALNTYYYKVWRVRYDNSAGGRARQENNFLHHTLDTGEGMCITIPMLYMAFAQRLGYPVYGVVAPEREPESDQVTFVGDVRGAGGDVVPSPTANNPYHCEMCGITPQSSREIVHADCSKPK